MAADHYRLYQDDVRLMKALGANAYRFSISWPRIFPDGAGAANPKGLDFYNRLVDELLANEIAPLATLYHWDLPQVLQERQGGWESRDTARAFADYAGYVAERLSDRVRSFFTTNEFTVFVEFGLRRRPLRARPKTSARAAQSGAAQRSPRPRPSRQGDKGKGRAGNPDRARRETAPHTSLLNFLRHHDRLRRPNRRQSEHQNLSN